MEQKQPLPVGTYRIEPKRIGQRLKELRNRQGFTAKQVAQALCVSANAVYKWEAGITVPSVDNFYLLSCVYETDLDHLILGDCPFDWLSQPSLQAEQPGKSIRLPPV